MLMVKVRAEKIQFETKLYISAYNIERLASTIETWANPQSIVKKIYISKIYKITSMHNFNSKIKMFLFTINCEGIYYMIDFSTIYRVAMRVPGFLTNSTVFL